MIGEELLTLAEAAEALGVLESSLRSAARRGAFSVDRTGETLRVTLAAVEPWAAVLVPKPWKRVPKPPAPVQRPQPQPQPRPRAAWLEVSASSTLAGCDRCGCREVFASRAAAQRWKSGHVASALHRGTDGTPTDRALESRELRQAAASQQRREAARRQMLERRAG